MCIVCFAKRIRFSGNVRPNRGCDTKFSSTNIIPTNLFKLGRADVDERQKVNLVSPFKIQEVPFRE